MYKWTRCDVGKCFKYKIPLRLHTILYLFAFKINYYCHYLCKETFIRMKAGSVVKMRLKKGKTNEKFDIRLCNIENRLSIRVKVL